MSQQYPYLPESIMAPPNIPDEDYTLSTDVVGRAPLAMNPLYTPKAISSVPDFNTPRVDQNFSDLTNYSTELMKSPAMKPEAYEPSGLRRLLAGVAGGATGYQGGAMAGLGASEHVLDTPYRRAMQKYNERVAPFGAAAKQRMDKYKNDIDYMQHSSDSFTKLQKTRREQEESARQEEELRLKSHDAQANNQRTEDYGRQVNLAGKVVKPGYNPSNPELYQENVIDKGTGFGQPTGIRAVSPLETLRMRARMQREHDERVAKFFNTTSSQVAVAGFEASRAMLRQKAAWSQFVDRKTLQPTPPPEDTDPSDPIMEEWNQFYSQWEAKQSEILGMTKKQTGGPTEQPEKRIGKYKVVK